MNKLHENWINFVSEGIEDGKHVPKYYAFDWDDNIVEMPTKIIVVDTQGKEHGMSTADFAEYRGQLGKEPFEYDGKMIQNMAQNAFRNFRVPGDGQFIKDISHAELGPSWDDFVECINSASIFSIITARGHKPSTLKRAVYDYIVSNFNGINSGEVIKNIKQYNKLFKTTGGDGSIKGYLDLCKFYPVSNDEVAANLGGVGGALNPEQLKVKALKQFINYCVKLNKGVNISVGFSDDDKKNIDVVEKHFSQETDIPKMTIKYTGKK